MTDAAYEMLFKPVMRRVMEVYQPEVVVFQSGEPRLRAPWMIPNASNSMVHRSVVAALSVGFSPTKFNQEPCNVAGRHVI